MLALGGLPKKTFVKKRKKKKGNICTGYVKECFAWELKLTRLTKHEYTFLFMQTWHDVQIIKTINWCGMKEVKNTHTLYNERSVCIYMWICMLLSQVFLYIENSLEHLKCDSSFRVRYPNKIHADIKCLKMFHMFYWIFLMR